MAKSVKLPPVVLVASAPHASYQRALWQALHEQEITGNLVLHTGCPCGGASADHREQAPDQNAQEARDTSKLLLADILLVLNPGGELADSTRRLIALAGQLEKEIRYSEPESAGKAHQASLDDYLHANPGATTGQAPYEAHSSDEADEEDGVLTRAEALRAQLEAEQEPPPFEEGVRTGGDGIRATITAAGRTWPVTIEHTDLRLIARPDGGGYSVRRAGKPLGIIVANVQDGLWYAPAIGGRAQGAPGHTTPLEAARALSAHKPALAEVTG